MVDSRVIIVIITIIITILLLKFFIAPNYVSSAAVSKRTKIFWIVKGEPTLIVAHEMILK